MTEHPKRDLKLGMFTVLIGVLYVAVDFLSLAISGEHSEYFDGWWIATLCIVGGAFLLLRYRFVRVRRFSRVVDESPYFRGIWMLAGLGSVCFGIYLTYLVTLVAGDASSVGGLFVLGLAAVFVVFGLALAGKQFRELRHA